MPIASNAARAVFRGDDESGYHIFLPGEYVPVREQDDKVYTFPNSKN